MTAADGAGMAATHDGAPLRPFADRLLRPTLPELWLFLAIMLPALAALIASLPTVDLAYQLRAGAEILAGRGIPTEDAWTFTAAGRPWLDQQWGAQVILAAFFTAGGWPGLAILRAALVALVSGLILLAVRRRAPGLGSRAGAWLTLGAFVVAAPALALRPQLLAMACFAATLVVLAGRRERPAGLWLLPVVAAVWANLHGSFVLAPALAGLAWLEDLHERSPRARRTLLVTVASGAATLATPFGIGAWSYTLGLATNREVTSRITEWQPPTLAGAPGILFWASVILVAIGIVALLRRRRDAVPWPAIVTLVAFAALGAAAERGIAWWSAVAAVTMAGLLVPAPPEVPAPPDVPVARIGPTGSRRGSLLNAVIGTVLLVAGLAMLPSRRPVDPGLDAPRGLLSFAPSGLTATLRTLASPVDRVWNPQPWGSWLEFAVPAPAYAFDSRIELIPGDAWADGDVVAAAEPGWDAILDDAGVTIVLTEGPETSPLAAALEAHAGWRLVVADGDGTLWERAAP